MSAGSGPSVVLPEVVERSMLDSHDLAEQADNEMPELGTDDQVSSLSLEFARLMSSGEGKEVDESQRLLRLPADFSGSLSQKEVRNRCSSVDGAESFYSSSFAEQWLRTVVTTQVSGVVPRRGENNREYDGSAGHEILSNVVPRRPFLKGLERVTAMCREHACGGGFFSINDLCGEQIPRPSCTNCALVNQLRIETRVRVETEHKMWFLGTGEVERVKHIKGEGSQGGISTIIWRHGTFARKRFFGSDDPSKNPAYMREVDVALTISHPNIVHCFGVSKSDHLDLFMEVLEEDLESFLSRLEENEPAFSFQDSLEVLLQVAEAVKHLHEKSFVHGDLKPCNILLSKLAMHLKAPFYLVKVADFGNTQRVDTAAKTNFDFGIGSPEYTAPEVRRLRSVQNECKRCPGDLQKFQCLQKSVEDFDARKIDVYSFGVLADGVLTAVKDRLKHSGSDANLSSFLRGFIRGKCQARQPPQRPCFADICTKLSSLIDKEVPEENAKRKLSLYGRIQSFVRKWLRKHDSRGTRQAPG